MKAVLNKWQFLLASLYTCFACAFWGAILLDIVYANAMSGNPGASTLTALFSRAADFLLLLGAITFLTGLGAVGAVLSLPAARNLFLISIFFIAAELLVPTLFGSLLLSLQANSGLHAGTWIRLASSTLSVVFAFLALWKLYPSTS